MRCIYRNLLDKLKHGFKNNRIIIIVGSRQVGKTTIMEMYKNDIPKYYSQFYFNLEDVGNLAIFNDIDSLRAYLQDNGVNIKKQKSFLIIDEFQYIKNATKLFKSIYDLFPLVKIIASGSSSMEIQKHLKESLAGRKKVYNLYPLSFDEFIRFKSEKIFQHYDNINFQDCSSISVEKYNKNYLTEHLVYGGYPKVTLLSKKIDKVEELQDIYNSYIQKDIKSLIKGENISGYNNLIKILASQIGNLLNIHELSNTLGIKRRQLVKYLSILEETFIIKLLRPFCSNKRTEISKMPKLYMMDSGIINFSIENFGDINLRPNLGNNVENYVLNEILKKKPLLYRLYFWRTKAGTEIDFILEGNNELIPIEVKWQNMVKPVIPKSFISFFSAHKNIKKGVIVTKDFSSKIKKEGKTIYFIPCIFIGNFIKALKI